MVVGQVINNLVALFFPPSTSKHINTVDNGDQVKDENIASPEHDLHVISKPKVEVYLSDNNTTTGFHGKYFVLKPGILKAKRTYILEVTVKDKSSDVDIGSDMTFFTVNEGPILGKCFVNPDIGIELETEFKIHCYEWKDAHTPLMYELSYYMTERLEKHVIYYGLNHDLKMKLPAGNLNNDFNLLFNIEIWDSLKARTSVCSIPLKVLPKYFDPKEKTPEELLKNVLGPSNNLSILLWQGNIPQTLQLIRLIANKLNQIYPVQTSMTPCNICTEIRETLLNALLEIPVLDQHEVVQVLSALLLSTVVHKQLSESCLHTSVVLLEKMTDEGLIDCCIPGSRCVESLNLLTKIYSSIIAAIASNNNIAPGIAKELVIHAHSYYVRLFKAQLQCMVNNEEAIQLNGDFLAVIGGRYDVDRILTTTINEAKFMMPNLNSVISRSNLDIFHPNTTSKLHCAMHLMIAYQQNPFIFSDQVHTEVLTHSLFLCNGTELSMNNLPARESVTMTIPRSSSLNLEDSLNYTLHKHQMNIHEFNISQDLLHQTIFISVQLLSRKKGRKFPITLYIGYNESVALDRYRIKQEFPTKDEKLQMTLPSSIINREGVYYLALSDSTFNAGRPRPGQLTKQDYKLQIWWIRCLHFNTKQDSWQDYGCQALQSSTYSVAHCRCSHLSSFGASFIAVHSRLIRKDLDDFFRLHENPVILVVMVCLVIFYLVLLIPVSYIDHHNECRTRIIALEDNNLSDRQKYHITIETGLQWGAGTTAKVWLVLHGEDGMSENRELLGQKNQSLFERGSRDSFLMTTKDSLGPVWKVQVWHNNCGPSASWYLRNITVMDINTDNTYYFEFEKWLAVEEDDGKVERESMALDGAPGFWKVLQRRKQEYISDYYLWLSVFLHPPDHLFTGVQRLSCCLMLICSYAALITICYKFRKLEYRGEFGLFDVSHESLLVGVVAVMLTLPLNLFITAIYRNSKKPQLKYQRCTKKHETELASSDIDPASFSRSGSSSGSLSALDHSLLMLQNLQDWARHQWSRHYGNGLVSSSEESIKSQEQQNNHLQRKYYDPDHSSSGFEDCSSQDHKFLEELPSHHIHSSDNPSIESGIDINILNWKEKHFPSRHLLPSSCCVLAWIFCIIMTAGSLTVTLYFGYWFGKLKTVLWLQSLYFSILYCMFIVHPILVLSYTVYSALRQRKHVTALFPQDILYTEDDIGKIATLNKYHSNMEFDVLKGIAARQRSRYLRFARSPQESELIKAREITMKEKKAFTIIGNVLKHFMFISVLLVIAFGTDYTTPYRVNQAMKNIFTRSYPNSFMDIDHPNNWWKWSKTSLLNGLYSDKSPNENRLIIQGTSSVVIGNVILRQLRSKYSIDTFGFNNSWIIETNQTNGTSWIWGNHAWYHGKGHVVKLKKTRQKALDQFEHLESNMWLDRNTQAIIVEFTAFNVPTNLFSSVRLMLEFPPSGGIFPYYSIHSVYLYHYISTADMFILFFELLYFTLILHLLVSHVQHIIKYKFIFWKNIWTFLEACILLLSLCYVICYIYYHYLISWTIETLRDSYFEEFLDLSFIAFWDNNLQTLVGLLLFFSIIRSLSVFRHFKCFAKYGLVYQKALKSLFVFMVAFYSLMAAFSHVGFLLFGSFHQDFRSFISSSVTLLAMMLGQFNLLEFYKQGHSIALLYTIIFILTMMVFLTGLVKAIMNLHYHIFKPKKSIKLSLKDIYICLSKRMAYWAGCRQSEQEGGKLKEVLPTEFTLTELEHQVDDMLFKMNALCNYVSLPNRSSIYGSMETSALCDNFITPKQLETKSHQVEKSVEAVSQTLTLNSPKILEIQCNLLSEPHLAQLLKLDSIGSNVLSQDKEQSMRLHLENELFCLLHKQENCCHSDRVSLGSYPVFNSNFQEESISPMSSILHLHQALLSSKTNREPDMKELKRLDSETGEQMVMENVPITLLSDLVSGDHTSISEIFDIVEIDDQTNNFVPQVFTCIPQGTENIKLSLYPHGIPNKSKTLGSNLGGSKRDASHFSSTDSSGSHTGHSKSSSHYKTSSESSQHSTTSWTQPLRLHKTHSGQLELPSENILYDSTSTSEEETKKKWDHKLGKSKGKMKGKSRLLYRRPLYTDIEAIEMIEFSNSPKTHEV